MALARRFEGREVGLEVLDLVNRIAQYFLRASQSGLKLRS